jgi:hypothetical protein
MRRSLLIRVATLLVIVATSAMPAFAAPTDESPVSGVERAITRIFNQIRKIIVKPLEQLNGPK